MNAANLFFALSQAICISLIQGTFTLLIVRGLLLASPGISSLWKYRLLLGSLVFLLIGFLYSAIKLYSPEIQFISAKPQLFLSEKFSLLKSIKQFLQQHSLLIFSVYILGLVAHIISLLSGLHKINRLKHDVGLKLLPEWQNKVKSLSNKFGLSTEVRLLFSEKLIVPFTVGFVKPIIFFPIGMLNQLSMEQVEAILLHELAHIKRNDYLINIIQKLIETVLFFNPVVWLFARDLKNEREYCCDDLVLSYTTNPGLYAKALLLIEENRTDYNQLAMAADGAGKHSLFNRIKRLNVMKTVNSNPKHKLLAIVALIAVSMSLAWAVPTDSLKVKKARQKSYAKYQVPPPAPLAPVVSDTTELAPPSPPAQPELRAAPPLPIMPNDTPPPPPVSPKKGNKGVQDTNKVSKYLDNEEWKDKQEALKKNTDELKKIFESAEWKTQQAEIKKNAEDLKKHFNSPEWKAQQKAIAKHSEEMKMYFNSPEWKKQQQLIAKNSEEIKKHFESPEWKAQMEEMNKKMQHFDSPEWKAQVEKMEKMGVEMEKKFNGPEFKKQIKKLEEQQKQIEKSQKEASKQ
ncbi:MAG: hypothetical protein JWN56_2077 [Sphingobacteriales bacterium]|nr:hypothetical protein [Sphingobacteriales bacterium]